LGLENVAKPLYRSSALRGEVRELTADDVRLFKPITDVDPGMVEAMREFRRKAGRPKAAAPKVHVGFRLAADIVASIKATGRGYNARVEQALREAGFGGKQKREASLEKASAAKKRRAAKPAAKRAISNRRA
jgi:uncharacterized protein (DUF4415 family)